MSLEHLVLLERNCFKDERTKGKERGQKMDVCAKMGTIKDKKWYGPNRSRRY